LKLKKPPPIWLTGRTARQPPQVHPARSHRAAADSSARVRPRVIRQPRHPDAGVALRGAYRGAVHRHAADIAARNGGGGHCGARGAGRAGAVGTLKMSRH